MKNVIALLITVGMLLLGAGAYAEADFTLLVYLCGSDLQENACDDIYEMGLAENGENVNIVLLAGGASEWNYDVIKGNTRNLITIRNGNFESVEDWGWASMGSGESLMEFLEYGLTNYPAKKTAVVLWDHGAGSAAGVCFDYTTQERDSLTLTEINDVLYELDEKLGGFHIDLFGCDACMMATYEMASMLSYYNIDYFAASEEIVPGVGWQYTPWLVEAGKNPDMTLEQLCALITDSYMEACLNENPDEYLTFSAIDLSKMAPLREAMEQLGTALQTELKGGRTADIRRGRSQMYTFGSYMDGSWDMVDLGAMLDGYAKFDPDGAARARAALEDAVLISRQTDNLNPCSGMSVMIPQDTKSEFETYSSGMDLSVYIPNWMGFVKSYAGQLTQGSYSFSQTTPQNITGSDALTQQLSAIFAGQPNVWFWNKETEAYEETAQTDGAFAADEGDYAFSASLSQEDLQYLDYVEGMMMVNVTDDELYGYVDMGLLQNNVVDWNSGRIYSLFDGTWPVLDEQMVPLYDQINNQFGRRSLIPVKLNGENTYLVVEFAAGSTEGRIIGANAGYDENGLPIRNTEKLKEGDRIVPVYTMYFGFDEDNEMEETEFEGDEIIWRDGLTVKYEDLSDEGDPLDMMFCFVLNDVFGEYDMTDIISFEL